MAVPVVCANGDERHRGRHGIEEGRARAGCTAVVRNLQNVGAACGAVRDEPSLFRRLGIACEQDADVARNVTLNKGVNVVVFKIFNEGNDWQGCLRFTDASDKAVTNLVIQLAP